MHQNNVSYGANLLKGLSVCVLVNGKVHNRIVASSFQATSEMELFKVEKLGIQS